MLSNMTFLVIGQGVWILWGGGEKWRYRTARDDLRDFNWLDNQSRGVKATQTQGVGYFPRGGVYRPRIGGLGKALWLTSAEVSPTQSSMNGLMGPVHVELSKHWT